MRRLSALLLVLASVSAHAQEEPGAYVGIGFGNIDFADELYRITYTGDASNTKLTGGYRFNETLMFEGSYSESGTYTDNQSGTIPNWMDQNGDFLGGLFTSNTRGSVDVLELRVLAHLKYIVLGIGFFSADVTGEMVGDSQLGSFYGSLDSSEGGYVISIGAQWDINKIGIRAEWEYYDMGSPSRLETLGVGITYGF
jgi:hypothetical protein